MSKEDDLIAYSEEERMRLEVDDPLKAELLKSITTCYTDLASDCSMHELFDHIRGSFEDGDIGEVGFVRMLRVLVGSEILFACKGDFVIARKILSEINDLYDSFEKECKNIKGA